MLKKRCVVVQSYWWHIEKIFIEKIIISHNPKYVSSLERNKAKLSDIRELWKKKNIQNKM